jgi:hypothetical protein
MKSIGVLAIFLLTAMSCSQKYGEYIAVMEKMDQIESNFLNILKKSNTKDIVSTIVEKYIKDSIALMGEIDAAREKIDSLSSSMEMPSEIQSTNDRYWERRIDLDNLLRNLIENEVEISIKDVLEQAIYQNQLNSVRYTLKYGDFLGVLVRIKISTDTLVASMDKAADGKAVAAAITAYTESLSSLSGKMKELQDKYPELKDAKEPPQELKDAYDKLNAMGEKLMTAMAKLSLFVDDPDVSAAVQKMTELNLQ